MQLRRLASITVAVMLSCGPSQAYKSQPTAPAADVELEPPRPLDFQIRVVDRDWNRLDLHASADRPLFVHFWASWCGPCVQELQTFNQIREQMADTSLAFLLISVDADPDAAWAFLDHHGIETFSYVIDRDHRPTIERLRGALDISRIPQTMILDTQGQLVYHHYAADWRSETWSPFLRRLLY